MTPKRYPLPGMRFLAIARTLFPASIVDHVFTPAVADLQGEWRETHSRIARAWLWCRGYVSLLVLATTTPMDVTTSIRTGREQPAAARGGGWFLAVLAITLYAATWPFFGPFAMSAVMMGVAVAAASRAWHTRHPSRQVDARDPHAPAAEINLSAIPVGGDVAGLIFAVGSVVIVIVGLPGVAWYLVATVSGGLMAALGIVSWRRAHARAGEPLSIVSR